MSFIEDYLLTTEGTEPCLEYHTWCMLHTLSVFAGKRIWFDLGHLRFYPHLYIILVGDPGSRKTTAMNFSRDTIRDSKVCPVSATQITKEALTQTMSATIDGKPKKTPFVGQKLFALDGKSYEYNQYAIFASELVDFIAVNPLGFLDFLTSVWDAPVIEVITKNKGVDYVENPCINFLACLTPTRMKGFMKQNILGAGYARRTAFVFSNQKKIIARPNRTQDQIDAYVRCVEFGKSIQSIAGPFTCTPELDEFYDHFYVENQKTIKDKHPNTQGWFETKPEILFKLGMLISLAETQERVITLPAYRLALRYCEMVEKNLERVFEGSGINPNAQVAAQVCRMLEALGQPMNKKHLEMMFFDQATDLNALKDTLSHLVNVGRLVEKTISLNGTLAGTIVMSPECRDRYTDGELVAFLKPSRERLRQADMDSTASHRLGDSLESGGLDLRQLEAQKPHGPAAAPEIVDFPADLPDLSARSNPS